VFWIQPPVSNRIRIGSFTRETNVKCPDSSSNNKKNSLGLNIKSKWKEKSIARQISTYLTKHYRSWLHGNDLTCCEVLQEVRTAATVDGGNKVPAPSHASERYNTLLFIRYRRDIYFFCTVVYIIPNETSGLWTPFGSELVILICYTTASQHIR
jgi:hypothetical protein